MRLNSVRRVLFYFVMNSHCALCELKFYSQCHQKYVYHETNDGNHKVGGFVTPQRMVPPIMFATIVISMLKYMYVIFLLCGFSCSWACPNFSKLGKFTFRLVLHPSATEK